MKFQKNLELLIKPYSRCERDFASWLFVTKDVSCVILERRIYMGNLYGTNGGYDNSFLPIQQADGKVLGRVRMMVKASSPQRGTKDYRFFVDPLSPLPEGFEDAKKYGFTGFTSRIAYGRNFETEDDALNYLNDTYGDQFVTFTPSIRNNRFFVLDDLQKAGRTPYMAVDSDYYPIPVFGTLEQPPFSGDINKFCQHMLTGKPLPGLSKKFWNNDIRPKVIVAATRNFEGKLGPWVLFAPMGNGEFNSTVIGEGGAYFSVKDHGQLGYATLESSPHLLRCPHAPLWFMPEGYMPWLISHLKPVPEDGNLLKDCGVENNPFEEAETIYLKKGKEGSHRLIVVRAEDEKESLSTIDEGEVPDSIVEIEKEKFTEKDAEAEKENVVENAEEKELTEEDFLSRLSEAAEKSGFLYNEEDLTNFHISVKSSRLTILAGMSGTGKSGLVRLYGKALGLPEERVRFLPVRPSWMDDGDILGYVDMKNMVYRSADTGLAELLIDAAKNPDKMYLLCFDEMNLARAEHYFAQFISVLEKEDNPVIRLYNPSLRSRLYNGEAYPAEIPIGKNIIFTGTVNVDESTYHFSDKILDRANVITLHQGKFHDLLKLGKKEDIFLEEAPSSDFYRFKATEDIQLHEKELDLLDALQSALEASGLQSGIGFRIACQMGRYLANIPKGSSFDREKGLDAEIVQRILPKLRGSSQQIGSLVCLNEKGELSGSFIAALNQFSDLSDFKETRKKLEAKARELKLYDYTV